MENGGLPVANFGSQPPRAVKCFGVSGFLLEKCHVFYENLFSTRHVGRVSDLLAAQLKSEGLDELRLRALLLFAVFEAYRTQQKRIRNGKSTDLLEKPLVIECGLDEEKLAVGLSFVESIPYTKFDKAFQDRINQQKPEGEFERLVCELYRHVDHLILRVLPALHRVEIISMMSKPGKTLKRTGEKAGLPGFELISLDQANLEETPPASTYTALGDLDYPTLLKEDQAKVEGKVGADGMTKISGTTQHINDGATRVKGGSANVIDGTMIHVKGGDGSGITNANMEAQVRMYQDQILVLQQKLAKYEYDANNKPTVIKSVTSFLNFMNPFKNSSAVAASAAPEAATPTSNGPTIVSSAHSIATQAVTPVEGDGGVVEIEAKNLETLVDRLEKELEGIKPELGTDHAKRWLTDVFLQLGVVKAKILDVSRKQTAFYRVRETELKEKESSVKVDISKREDTIRQQEANITRLKEELKANGEMLDQLKNDKHAASAEQMRRKLELAEKRLNASGQQNHELKQKIEELTNKLALAQSNSKGSKVSAVEFQSLQAKYDHVVRQCDEFLKANRQLSEKLAEAKKEKNVTNTSVTDLKKKLETAQKKQTEALFEVQQLKEKVDEMRKIQERLKEELEKAQKASEAKPTTTPNASGGGKKAA